MNLQVVQDLKGRIQRLPNFQRNVVSVRRQLMGIATSPEHKRYYILVKSDYKGLFSMLRSDWLSYF